MVNVVVVAGFWHNGIALNVNGFNFHINFVGISSLVANK